MNTKYRIWVVLMALLAATMVAEPARGQSATPSPGNARGAFVPVEGSKLYYEECGRGPQTVVLIHDGVVDSAVWNDVWTTFCQRFHTIRYDRRGYGRSPEATTWYSEVDDLATLLLELKVNRAVLVGSSHGGELSVDFTLAYPEVVQQLVLVGPVVSGMPYSKHFLERSSHALDLLRRGDVKNALAEWSQDRYLIAPGNEEARKHLVDLLSANPQDMTHADYPLPAKPALSRLHEIRVPTLILVGDADIPDVHAHAGAIEAGIPNARRVVIAGVGHLMYLEKPEEFARQVVTFIESHAH